MKILILAPHADDAELNCGGSISRFIKDGKQVFLAVFAVSGPDTPQDRVRELELKSSCNILGVELSSLFLYKHPVGYFSDYGHQIRNEMYKLGQELKPDLVILPAKEDVHQDHSVIAREGLRVFKWTNIIAYEMLWNNFGIAPNFFITFDKQALLKKVQAMAQYKSQAHKQYMDKNLWLSLARINGFQAGADFAEAFKIIKLKY